MFEKVCTSFWCHLLFQWYSCCKYFIGPEVISVVNWKACIILNFEHDILVCLYLKQALVLLSILENRVDYTFYRVYTWKIKSKNWVISWQISLWEKCLEHFIYKVTNRVYCRPIWLNNIYHLWLYLMFNSFIISHPLVKTNSRAVFIFHEEKC